jgi:hypothetical protein
MFPSDCSKGRTKEGQSSHLLPMVGIVIDEAVLLLIMLKI